MTQAALTIPKSDLEWDIDNSTFASLWLDSTIPQGSDVWLEWRKQCGGTATQANVVSMNPLSYPNTPKTWADQRAGVGSEISAQGRIAMAHGSEHEDDARRYWEEATTDADTTTFDPVCVKTTFDDGKWNIGASLDGFRFDTENNQLHYLEIKCPYTGDRSKTWKDICNRTIPDHYIWQMAHQALTLGAHTNPDMVHGWFIVYLPNGFGPNPNQPYLKWLHVPSTSLMDRMTTLLDLWPRYIGGEVQPGDLRGFSFDTDPDLTMALQSYLEAHKAKAEATKEEARAKKAILEQAMILNGATDPERPPTWIKKIHLDGLTITRTQRNTVNWSQLAKDHPEIDTTPYESATESWRVTVSKDK